MLYAKVHSAEVLQFPYTLDTLRSENPYTDYDNRFDVIGWYNQTEDARRDGKSIVEVIEQDPPIFNTTTQIIEKESLPSLIDNNWVLSWKIINRSEDEIAQYLEVFNRINAPIP